MTPYDICIDYGQAKILRDFGIKQGTSCFVWIHSKGPNNVPQVMARQYLQCDSRAENDIVTDAFTFEELSPISNYLGLIPRFSINRVAFESICALESLSKEAREKVISDINKIIK